MSNNYVSILGGSKKHLSLMMCGNCGVETPSIGGNCMCSNCESMVTHDRASLEKLDHALCGALVDISGSMSDRKYDDAITAYDKLIEDRKDPMLMYAEAIAYLKYSNNEITRIGYMKPGFMEDNTAHRDMAAKLASSAKRLLAKAIRLANMELSNAEGHANMLYCRFLAQVKMGNVKGALQSVKELEKSGNEYAYNYARMVFESYMEKYEDAMKTADALTKEDSFSINAFYYIGLALFKKRRAKEAKQVLQGLNKILKNDNLEALILEIDYQLPTSR